MFNTGRPLGTKSARFPATDWRLVHATRGADDEGRQARARLCELYWYPVYAFVRRCESTRSPDDALDLTQEFLTLRLEKADLADADPQKGRFSAWLIGALRHFLSNRRKFERARKRRPRNLVSIDGLGAEERYRLEPRDPASPERLFQRALALGILQRGLERLEQEHALRGQAEWFREARHLLPSGGREEGYAELERRWAMSPGTLKVRVRRMRQRLHCLIRRELAERVGPSHVEAEIEFLIDALDLPATEPAN